jgi:hypothetical protein
MYTHAWEHIYTFFFFFLDQAVLELRNSPASASGVLELKECATIPNYTFTL